MKRTAPPPPRPLSLAVLLVAVAAWASLGCAKIPLGRAAVDTLRIEGNAHVASSDIGDNLATASSTKFLGLFRGVFAYEIFDHFVFQRDLERVERYYRARGYYQAHVRAGRVKYTTSDHVNLTIEVDEGPTTAVRDVVVRGVEALPKPVAEAARASARAILVPGRSFDEEALAVADAAIGQTLADRGYAFVKLKRSAFVDLPGHFADIVFEVEPDQPAHYGEIRIEGLGDLPEGPVRRAIALAPGTLYSASDLLSARQAVLDLGVFSAVSVNPDLPDPPPVDRVVPVTVKVERSPLHVLRLGGGVELDSIRTDLHLQVGWENRNFLDGLRTFSMLARPGIVLYPTRLPEFQAPTNVLPEARVRAELRQPGLFEARTAGFVRGQVNVYPLLLSPNIDPGAPVLGYREVRGSVGLDRTVWKFYLSPLYNFQTNTPFAFLGNLDPALTTIVISYMDLLTVYDFRDDPVKPHSGLYFSNELQVAGGPFFGDARDLRVQPEARAYVPIARRVTLAMRGTIGFLFPYNYADAITSPRSVYPVDAPAERDIQLVYLRGFFSGGPSSNRGYPLRGVSPHGIVPFACSAATASDPLKCSVPLSGLSLWEASVELRFPVVGPLAFALFVDASDVSRRRLNLRFNHPHLSVGLGARYDTPIGPVRMDVGYRIPGLQTLVATNAADEGDPGTFFGAPIAVALAIGEAF